MVETPRETEESKGGEPKDGAVTGTPDVRYRLPLRLRAGH